MLKKACALSGLVMATAAGALISSSPASATAPAWGGCCGVHGRLGSFVRHGNFNASQNQLWNRIRIKIRNRNNNVAINNQREQEQQRQRQFEFDPPQQER